MLGVGSNPPSQLAELGEPQCGATVRGHGEHPGLWVGTGVGGTQQPGLGTVARTASGGVDW